MNGKIIPSETLTWTPHPNPNHVGVTMQTPVDAQTNPLATVHRVRITPGGAIVPHIHEHSAETFVIVAGHALCTMGDATSEFQPGSTGYAPAGIRHGLKNIGEDTVELVTVFTPPT